VLLWTVVRAGGHRTEKQLTFTQFMQAVDAGKVKAVTVNGQDVHGIYQNENDGLRTTIPANYPEIYKRLEEKGVNIDAKAGDSNNWVSFLINLSPFILLFAFWIFMMRQMQSGGNKALSFGKSRARLHSTQQK
jgi:cell division protease FtsH